ncbi:hypothetical protein HY17_14815 [Hyphomonas sp. CY54-11-8]|nr:hypothetical protein HY17_14815 [Hyphomonas sp. CY54-11-8]
MPRRNQPASASRMPDISTARIKPSMPWVAAVVLTSTINAPAGPPIWNRLPPSSETRKPPTIAVIRPCAGLAPDATAMAMDNGKATIATVRPAMASARSLSRPYPSRSTVTSFGV